MSDPSSRRAALLEAVKALPSTDDDSWSVPPQPERRRPDGRSGGGQELRAQAGAVGKGGDRAAAGGAAVLLRGDRFQRLLQDRNVARAR